VEAIEGNHLRVNLGEIEEARKTLERIRVNDVFFSNDNVIVDFNLIPPKKNE
jgi:hypothetical protein